MKVSSREDAMKIAKYMGCSGAHQRDDGNWLPCADEETLMRISNAAEAEKALPRRKKKKRDEWEDLNEGGVIGIDTLPDGSLVSAPIMGVKATMGQRIVRRTDPDSFSDRDSAKVRSRQLGCIGIRQYQGTDGKPVWLPCTNESDYRRAMGTSPLGRIDIARQQLADFRRMSRLAKKSEIFPELKAAEKIELAVPTVRALTSKIREHNRAMSDLNKPEWTKASLGQLKNVYRRGAAAYSQSNNRSATRSQWAMGRVNAFLTLLEKGKPTNLRYLQDTDLLDDEHPWKRKNRLEAKGIGRRIGSSVRFDPRAIDADGDGKIQDGTPFERPAARTPKLRNDTLFDVTPYIKKPVRAKRTSKPVGQAPVPLPFPPNEPISRKTRKSSIPDYFKTLKFTRHKSMLADPQDTKEAFSIGRRRYTDERYTAVHKPIIDAILGSVSKKRKAGEPKTMWVLGGTSGSYKSSLRREGFQGIPSRDGAIHVDPDEVKEMMPEYTEWADAGILEAADLTHQESRDIARAALRDAIKTDNDIVYDSSGQFNSGARDLETARRNGYKIVAHYTTGDLAQFMKNVKDRQKQTGRGVPPWIVKSIAKNLPSYTRELNKRGAFDEFYLWDTTTPGKRTPVAKKIGNGKLEILDNSLWERYLNGGK